MKPDFIFRIGFCVLLLSGLSKPPSILCAQSTKTLVCGSQAVDHSHPYAMSYGRLWNYIQEYENPSVPAELQRELRGDQVSVTVVFDEHGRLGSCNRLSVKKDPLQKAVPVSQSVEKKGTDALCSSIQTWKTRLFVYCGKAVSVFGPLVFNVRNEKFVLVEVKDPRWRTGPAPVERNSIQ